MSFGRWYPLAEAAELAPAAPGVYQVRIETGLIDYPSGKSAMIHYAAADDVRSAVAALAADHPGAPWLCRHAAPLEGDRVAVLERLLDGFRRRFGAPPTWPA